MAGFDVQRRQITFDAADTASGEAFRVKIDSTPATVEQWVGRFQRRVVHVAVRGLHRLVVRRRVRSSVRGRSRIFAEPIETSALRGRTRRAMTDRADAKWLRQLCSRGGCRSLGCPPSTCVSDAPAPGCPTRWPPSAPAGCSGSARRCITTRSPAPRDDLRTLAGREFLAVLQLPVDAQEGIRVALEMIDLLEMQTAQIDRDLPALAHCQPGCRALMDKIYAIGERSSLDTLCELGDVSRPCVTPGRQARRDRYRRSPLRSDRQAGEAHPPGLPGMPPELRWALYEAAQSACRKTSPDHADYQALKQRGLSHTRASLTVALKLARRSYPVLRELGPGGLDPIID